MSEPFGKGEKEMKISVYIASNKPYAFPADPVYLPIQVGRQLSTDSFTEVTDGTGDNISEKNKTYCELTALYWMWKNDRDSDYLGLCHYRRYFAGRRFGKKRDRILTGPSIESIFAKNPVAVIVPKKRNYLWDTLYSHYAHTHGAEHLDIARQILVARCPEYVGAFDRTMKRHTAYMFNMFIMSRESVAAYSKWLFDVLEEMESRIDTSEMSAFDARLFGRVSELLFNVWLEKNRMSCVAVGYVNLSKTRWAGKIKAYLSSKFFGKKLEQSY